MGDADLAEELVELLEREDVEDAVALAGALADAGVLSDLIAALRTYSRLDEAPEQDVDLRGGLEDTLRILGPKLAGAGRAQLR